MRIFSDPVERPGTDRDLGALISPVQPDVNWEPPALGAPWVVIRSKLLGEDILLVCERGRVAEAERAHPGLTTYVPSEMDVLGDFVEKPDVIRRLHAIKREMNGWLVRPRG